MDSILEGIRAKPDIYDIGTFQTYKSNPWPTALSIMQ